MCTPAARCGARLITIDRRFGGLSGLDLSAVGERYDDWIYLDRVFILRRVQEHIAVFGGDPG